MSEQNHEQQARILEGLADISTVLTAINDPSIRDACLAGAAALRQSSAAEQRGRAEQQWDIDRLKEELRQSVVEGAKWQAERAKAQQEVERLTRMSATANQYAVAVLARAEAAEAEVSRLNGWAIGPPSVSHRPPTISLLAERGWQDISTAPKNRSWFLGWNEDMGCFVFRDGPGLITGEDPMPTHWQPLPSPPQEPTP